MSKSKKKWDSARINNATYQFFFMKLMSIALSCFKWENLPDSIDERFLELTLANRGSCLFFKDEELGFLTLPANLSGQLNVYNIPKIRQAFASTGYNKMCDDKDSVIIFNNYLHFSTLSVVEHYAIRLYEMQRTIDVNVKAQKTPKIFKSNEQQRLTLQNIFMKYEGNEDAIFIDKDFDMNALQVFDTSAPYVADKIRMLMSQTFSNFLNDLGIEAITTEKKERINEAETESTKGYVEIGRNIFLNARKQACDEINRMFDLNINVEFDSKLISSLNKNVDLEMI
ncbi:hypothetical protein [uncultured Thomasclavelia sp.]|uniref:hypothetical protein n=1 Tax=uncultured Thomasclavelia sp. TaxID=3025759 RepID=UPI00280A5D72|nr:hypothetical protein [uncultured Thomasclavelia sp.]